MSELSRCLQTQQTVTPAYLPWINGSVERANRDILQVIRAMNLEYKVRYKDWVFLVSMVQSNLNHAAVPSLGNRAPVELFPGLECPNLLREFYLPGRDGLQTIPDSDEIDSYLGDLRNSVQTVDNVVEGQRLKQRRLNKKRELGVNLVNFAEGDIVVSFRVDKNMETNYM